MSVQSQVSINSKPCCPSAILNVIPSFYRIDLARILTHGPIDLSPPSPRIRFQGTWIWVRQDRSGINRILITLAAPCYKKDFVADSKDHLWTHCAHISNFSFDTCLFTFSILEICNHDKYVTWLAASNIMWMTWQLPKNDQGHTQHLPGKNRWNMVVAVSLLMIWTGSPSESGWPKLICLMFLGGSDFTNLFCLNPSVTANHWEGVTVSPFPSDIAGNTWVCRREFIKKNIFLLLGSSVRTKSCVSFIYISTACCCIADGSVVRCCKPLLGGLQLPVVCTEIIPKTGLEPSC